ncbi:MAG: DNA polymerase I [Microcoleaceae cyanobacterium]
MAANPPLFILVDGHSLAFRAYFAYAKSRDGGLRTKTGIPTSVCFGFLKSLLEMIKIHQPDYLAIAFDREEPTFRHEADITYKADRAETPEDFLEDIRNLYDLLEGFHLPVVTRAGYEADDVLGTLTHQGIEAGFQVKILSGDQDLFQLIDPEERVKILHLSHNKGSTPVEFGIQEVYEKLKVQPDQVVDYKALCGDKSDNIPGVRGIGEKTAVQLLQEHNSLEGIYNSIDQIKGATRKKLEEGKTAAYHSQYMARIIRNVPLDLSPEICKFQGLNLADVLPLLQKLEFHSFIQQIQPQALEQNVSHLKETATSESFWGQGSEDLWFWSAEDTQVAQQIQVPIIQPQIIQTVEQLQALCQHLERFTNVENPVAWDTETTALEPRDAELVGIGCCWGAGTSDMAYIPLGHTLEPNLEPSLEPNLEQVVNPNPQLALQLELQLVLDQLRPILESDRYPKALQNAKFDRLIFRVQGIQLAGVVFDTMLASYVLNPESTHNLSALSLKYLGAGLTAQSYNDLVPKGKTIADLEIATVAQYCGLDAYTTFQLVFKLKSELQKNPSLLQLFNEIEQPLEPVLAEMEFQGIRIDTAYLKTLSQQLEYRLIKIEQQAYQAGGEEFNLGSPKQLSQLLFETLALSKKKTRKTKTGYSTDAKVLEKLKGDHPVIDSILEHRTLAKLKSTYVDALPELVHPQTQRVHTDFNQAITATGRLSSSNPNLQNIPIRTEFSRQIRQAFIPESGWSLVTADYSQIELRILAHLSGEEVLIDAYRNNQDVHTLTAQLLFEKEIVSADERRLGKTINFGVIYGMGAQRFAREAKVSQLESKQFIERFNERYSKVFDYLEMQKKKAVTQGYVETILGRRRYFNFLSGSLQNLLGRSPDDVDLEQLKGVGQNDAQLLRAASNAPIQGSSADIIKIAMVKLHEILRDYKSRLLLQVHDELVFEVPPSEWQELQTQIQASMENAIQLKVPLLVDIHVGENWMEAK